MKKCTLVIPCYNEADRLDRQAFARFLNDNPAVSCLFVNDGSRDATGEMLRNLCRGRSNAYLLELEQNQGKAEAVRLGMLAAAANTDTPLIGFWDADCATPLEELPRFLDAAAPGVLLVSGCRLKRLGGEVERSLLRHLLGRSFATAISCFLKLPVYDTQCGAKLYRTAVVGTVCSRPFVTRWFFDVEIFCRMIAEYGREKVRRSCIELPLNRWAEVGESKLRLLPALGDFMKLVWAMEFYGHSRKQ